MGQANWRHPWGSDSFLLVAAQKGTRSIRFRVARE